MKRFGFLYEKIITHANLLKAYRNAKRDKSHYREVRQIEQNVPYFINKLHEMLKKEEYKVGRYKLEIKNDMGKERHLYKLPFYPDRVIQWAILLQLEPIFMNTFTVNTSASIKGRGIHHAYRLMLEYLKDVENTEYYLKIDIRKFYDTIDKTILKDKLARKFKDPKLLRLLSNIIDSFPREIGIPIGSYLSQFLANFYLSAMDHFIKERLNCRYYVRYMDDVVIMGGKHRLHRVLRELFYFTYRENLEIKSNFRIALTCKGIDFVGYVFRGDAVWLRKSTKLRMIRRLTKVRGAMKRGLGFSTSALCTVRSYEGWLRWCNSRRLRLKYLKQFKDAISLQKRRTG